MPLTNLNGIEINSTSLLLMRVVLKIRDVVYCASLRKLLFLYQYDLSFLKMFNYSIVKVVKYSYFSFHMFGLASLHISKEWVTRISKEKSWWIIQVLPHTKLLASCFTKDINRIYMKIPQQMRVIIAVSKIYSTRTFLYFCWIITILLFFLS